jgi:predicted ATPase
VLLLQTLLGNRFRRLSSESETWEWDLNKIRAECVFETLLDIIIDTVNKSLSDGVQEVLTICACIGSHFSLSTLDMTVNTKTRQLNVAEALEEATLAGLLREDPVTGYCFASDDIRRIIYEHVPQESGRALLHLSIGYQLNGRLEVEKAPDPNTLLLINRQLNMGSGMVTELKG